MRNLFKCCLLGVGLCSIVSSAAVADDAVVYESASPKYALQITPYGWATGMRGEVSPFRRLPSVKMKKNFFDVLDKVHLAGFVDVYGRYDNFILSGDMMYVHLQDAETVGPLPAFPPLVPTNLTLFGEVDSKVFMGTLQAGYRVYERGGYTLDALVGGRAWHVSNDVRVMAGPVAAKHNESFHWIDPIIGVRGFVPLSDNWSVQAQATYGGFDVQAKKTWSVDATVNYVLNDRFSVSAGYKVLAVDYRRDGYVFDNRLKGPVIGATYRF